MDREQSDALQIAYNDISKRYSISFDSFLNAMATYEVLPVKINGNVVGGIFRKGSEIHASVSSEVRGRWLNKAVLKFIDSVVDECGEATTKVVSSYEMGHWFAKRLGFILQREDNGIHYYVKDTKCLNS